MFSISCELIQKKIVACFTSALVYDRDEKYTFLQKYQVNWDYPFGLEITLLDERSHTQYPEKVYVWMGILGNNIIGPSS